MALIVRVRIELIDEYGNAVDHRGYVAKPGKAVATEQCIEVSDDSDAAVKAVNALFSVIDAATAFRKA